MQIALLLKIIYLFLYPLFLYSKPPLQSDFVITPNRDKALFPTSCWDWPGTLSNKMVVVLKMYVSSLENPCVPLYSYCCCIE